MNRGRCRLRNAFPFVRRRVTRRGAEWNANLLARIRREKHLQIGRAHEGIEHLGLHRSRSRGGLILTVSDSHWRTEAKLPPLPVRSHLVTPLAVGIAEAPRGSYDES